MGDEEARGGWREMRDGDGEARGWRETCEALIVERDAAREEVERLRAEAARALEKHRPGGAP